MDLKSINKNNSNFILKSIINSINFTNSTNSINSTIFTNSSHF